MESCHHHLLNERLNQMEWPLQNMEREEREKEREKHGSTSENGSTSEKDWTPVK